MSIDIICPLYEAESYLPSLHASLLRQKEAGDFHIRYILTRSKDRSEEILKDLQECSYRVIEKKDFSHSLTREEEALSSKADILVFISQDIRIVDDYWLKHLTAPLVKKEAEASYSRQICDKDIMEKYIREKNYPDTSRTVAKEDIPSLGLKTFFFSDAASAVRRDIFVSLNGYDHKNFSMNEDMYLAYKIIMAGYRIRYCADAAVIHYHEQSLKELYKRYEATGVFFQENSYLTGYGMTGSGADLAKYVLRRALKEKNGKVLLQWLPNMAARYLGMKAGQSKNSKK